MSSSRFCSSRARAGHFAIPVLAIALVAAGCGEQSLPTMVPSARSLVSTIADASRDYKKGFYWLPPMVKMPAYTGTFDAALSSSVEICELVGDACGTLLSTWTMTSGPNGETVVLNDVDQLYQVNWHTNEFALSTSASYRVSVFAGSGVLLGYADVQPVDNGSGLKNVDTDEYIGLVDGRTLPIKFRIETGVVASVRVEPAQAEAEPEATQQFVATVIDLHGNVLDASVVWASSDEGVATVDQAGLAMAVSEGAATISATHDFTTGSATLNVVDGGISVVTAGRGHACALDADGRAFCWGHNDQGQLGDGTQTDRRSPTPVAGGLTFVAIESGAFHTCGITTAGAAFCWGLNQSTQLGDGTTTFRRLTPVAVAGGLTFASISTGSNNTCALTADGKAYCWGQGAFGALGNGSFANVNATSPVAVIGGHTFATLAAGSQYACGVTLSGEGLCWGNDNSRRLGGATGGNRSSPQAITGGLVYSSISTGDGHVCGVTTSGAGYCWGSRSGGRLGNGEAGLGSIPTPQLVLGGLAWTSLSAGGQHTCGVTATGQGYCWGGNVDGSLGTGSLLGRSTPGLVAGGHTWASISASSTLSFPGGGSIFAFSCGVTVVDQIYCWGSNFQGQLGIGTGVSSRITPTLIAAFPQP